MPTWPATLPRPTVETYALKPVDPVSRTQFEAGNSRSRRRFQTAPTIIPVRWVFTEAEMAVFEAWHKYEALDGAAWFDTDLANGLGISSHNAKFEEMWDASARAGLNFIVTAKLRVSARPVMTAAELEVASAYAPADLLYISPTLHTLIHTTLPAYW